MSDIKYLTTCIILYTSDADERYPPNMTSARTLEPFLRPYASNASFFRSSNPAGGEILGDKRLSGKSATALASPVQTIMLHDSLPWPEHKGIAGYADGHVTLIPFGEIASTMARDPFLKPIKKGKPRP